MKVRVKKSSIVEPAEATPRHNLWISKLDLLHVRLHIGLVHFYRHNGSTNFFNTDLLKEGLSKTLVPFYPAAGRLRRHKNDQLHIHCNAKGALFLEAESDSTIDDLLLDFSQGSKLGQLIPAVDYSTDISSCPLLLVQVTRFKCGGICVGVGWHHLLSDGAGYGHFINSWGNITRGFPVVVKPFLDRTVLRAWTPTSPTFRHTEYEPPPSMNNPRHQFQPISTTILQITTNQLTILKRIANERDYSTYEILTAHVWRCACTARGLVDDQATRLHVAVSGRSRLSPPLPLGYFGNAIFHARPVAFAGDLRREALKQSVKRIRESIKRVDNEYMRSALAYLDQHPDIDSLSPQKGNEIYRNPNLAITAWNRLSLSESDFGWGKPRYVGPTGIYSEGKGYIGNDPKNDGSLSLAICLETNHLKLFKKIFYDNINLGSSM